MHASQMCTQCTGATKHGGQACILFQYNNTTKFNTKLIGKLTLILSLASGVARGLGCMWVNCLPIACHNSDACFTSYTATASNVTSTISCMYHSLHCLQGITTTCMLLYSINSTTVSCIIVHFGQLHYTNCYHKRDSPLTALVIAWDVLA